MARVWQEKGNPPREGEKDRQKARSEKEGVDAAHQL